MKIIMKNQICWQDAQREAPQWFKDAKFGLFFHWGPYSVPACENEWYSRNMYSVGGSQHKHHTDTYGSIKNFGYKDFLPMLTGEKFSAEEWANLVVRSGAKYAGPVTEHSDNFSLWDSKVNPINSVNYGPHKDITGLCFEEFKKRNIKLLATFHHQWLWGWFMSTDAEADVYVPENEQFYGKALPLETNRYMPYRLPDEDFNNMWYDKVEEVVAKYKPDVLYFDSRTNIIDEKFRHKMASYYYGANGVSDGIISYKQQDFPNGTGVLDLERGKFDTIQPHTWQIDDRLEDNVTWCIVQNPKYRTALDVIQQLCDVVAKNGNLLLNVGPCADGSFHPDAISRLEEIGDWLNVNGEAIFETVPYTTFGEGPTTEKSENYSIDKIQEQIATGKDIEMSKKLLTNKDFRFTQKGNSVYAIGFLLNSESEIQLKTFGNACGKKISAVKVLGTEEACEFIQNDTQLKITMPKHIYSTDAYAIKLTF